MHKKIYLTLILISSAFSISCSNQLPRYNNDFWQEIRYNFTIKKQENNAISKQLKQYIANKKSFEKSLKDASPYMFFIKEEIKKEKLPMELILLPMVESEYKPFAHSWAGASGIWQMMPGTASGLNLKINWWIDERRSITKSTKAALHYLKYLNDFFNNNWLLAIAGYDSGAGTVQKAIKKANHKDFWQLPLPRETQNYLPKLFALKEIIQNPEKYGITLPKIPNKPYFISTHTSKQIPIQKIAQTINISTKQMYNLNPQYRRWSTAPKSNNNLLIPIEKASIFHKKITTIKQHKTTNLKKYKIKPGDSINLIAKKNDIKVSHLLEINKLKSTLIKKGHYLLLPSNHLKINGLNREKTIKIRGDNLPGPKRLTYIVKKHDTIKSIAKKFNIAPRELKYWNQLKTKLKSGSKLTVWKNPNKTPKKYTVKKRDNLLKISKKYKISVKSIKRKNHLKNNIIKLNQELILR
jgi:membrane-bound lytic murein transglycosylase D